MKKVLICLLAIIVLIPSYIVKAENEEVSLIQNAKSGILIEATTGKIIYEKNKDEKLPMASLTKMMAQILILENIESGNLTWDEKVKVSKNAADFGGSQIWLEANEIMSVRDLFKGLSMASANDATVALAERIAGTEEEFVKQMNAKAKTLGLKDTVFINSTGLDEEGHYSTAADLAIIAKELLKHDQILEFSSVYEDYLRTDTPNKFWLVNTNKLIRFYEGADGLKTGHTDDALYCIALTAKRNGMRLIGIVLGEEDIKTRNAEASNLLDYGFNLYKVNILKQKGELVDTIKLDKGNVEKVGIVTKQDALTLVKKNETAKEYTTELKLNELKLPIKKGTTVGKLLIKDGNTIIQEVEVTVDKDIKKTSLWKLYLRILRDVLTGEVK